MHLAAGWSFRHRRTVLIGWPPPYSPAEAGQMNASRTVAFASLAPVAAAQDAPAATASPAARAAVAMSTPMPRPAPVMSQTFLSLMWVNFSLVEVPHPASFAVALSTQPASTARWQTLMRGVLAGTPSQTGPLVQLRTWQA